MPTYEYRCTQCQLIFERHQAVGEVAPECPQCGGSSRKVFSSVGLIFKGSGFHTTDYRKTSENGDQAAPVPAPEIKPPAESSPSGASSGASSGTSSDKSSDKS
jgi:putative FmdB family regulatory protein